MSNSYTVHVSVERARGCGYRIAGADGVGIYLMGDYLMNPCNRLPFPLTTCPCCGAGIKFTRGFQWIDPVKILDPCIAPYPSCQGFCPICNPGLLPEDRGGLMWVGGKHYPTPAHFTRESKQRGISKKIPAIPNDFDIGAHHVYLAHKKAITDWNDPARPQKPGIFMAFRPTHIDLVIDNAGDVPERAKNLIEKHKDKGEIRLVQVVKYEIARQGVLLNGAH